MYHDLHKDYHQARGMRAERYRLTSYEDEAGAPLFTELFDHPSDSHETRNLALDTANAELVSTLRRQLDRGWQQCATDLAQVLEQVDQTLRSVGPHLTEELILAESTARGSSKYS